jgi:hypothetical protein
MKRRTICPNCDQQHNDPYTEDSDWCYTCVIETLANQEDDDIQLGETFGP